MKRIKIKLIEKKSNRILKGASHRIYIQIQTNKKEKKNKQQNSF